MLKKMYKHKFKLLFLVGLIIVVITTVISRSKGLHEYQHGYSTLCYDCSTKTMALLEGTTSITGDYCSKCGGNNHALRRNRVCEKCGRVYASNVNYCKKCGSEVSKLEIVKLSDIGVSRRFLRVLFIAWSIGVGLMIVAGFDVIFMENGGESK